MLRPRVISSWNLKLGASSRVRRPANFHSTDADLPSMPPLGRARIAGRLSFAANTPTSAKAALWTRGGAACYAVISVAIQERVWAGVRAAKAKGTRLGRPRRVLRRDEAPQMRAQGMSWRRVAQSAKSANVNHDRSERQRASEERGPLAGPFQSSIPLNRSTTFTLSV